MPAEYLLGPTQFPAGLFANDRHAELSAVIFSNACSISKLNRVAISGGGAPEGYRYTRLGHFFDRTPGALRGIPFCLDITGDEYRGLWPHDYEPWTAEIEVFHNPFARHPVSSIYYLKRSTGSRRTVNGYADRFMRRRSYGRKL
ncbi:hypothetical protein [Mesorhizobium sp.]|uniref:hypothetical protein n=1 Tax=Mesorhizobium sp. TaxID=1871066 RepID=UPI000FE5548B|nr:hypothetical protein [Mesorhizobium sp.]RWQ12787.1 MAG: hypothetical protein EOR93_32780 [Mesorhizobium sp.]